MMPATQLPDGASRLSPVTTTCAWCDGLVVDTDWSNTNCFNVPVHLCSKECEQNWKDNSDTSLFEEFCCED